MEALDLERLADDVEVRRAAAKTLKGFCFTYLPHHFPADPSDFFDEMAGALQDHENRRLEIIGFRGCAKSTMASLALVLWAALEHRICNGFPFSCRALPNADLRVSGRKEASAARSDESDADRNLRRRKSRPAPHMVVRQNTDDRRDQEIRTLSPFAPVGDANVEREPDLLRIVGVIRASAEHLANIHIRPN